LRRIRILGSVHWITNSDSDPAPELTLFVSFLVLITSCRYIHLHRSSKSKSLRSHQTVKIKIFLNYSACWWRIRTNKYGSRSGRPKNRNTEEKKPTYVHKFFRRKTEFLLLLFRKRHPHTFLTLYKDCKFNGYVPSWEMQTLWSIKNDDMTTKTSWQVRGPLHKSCMSHTHKKCFSKRRALSLSMNTKLKVQLIQE
jgi:hypothetical protein